MKISVSRAVEVSNSSRAKQLEGMFDVPRSEKCSLKWEGDFPIEDKNWNVGLIVGPSGCGKSTILSDVFGAPKELDWNGKSVIDDFDPAKSMSDVADVCGAVGFNTIPAWLRPYHVLSNGERFRVDLARRLLELDGNIVVDEFTSVVDRQVAQIGSHAVQKYVRKHGKKFVAAACHFDIVDWLQPDWVLEPATMRFQWRELRRRPAIEVSIGRLPYSAWKIFAPFHYMSASLHPGAKCFGLWANGQLASFVALLHRPHPIADNVMGVSRTVTLPDWQGLGLAFVLNDTIGAAMKAVGKRMRNYPAHPNFVRAHARSTNWRMEKKPGLVSLNRDTTTLKRSSKGTALGQRPCAVFEYCGPAMDKVEAQEFLQ